MDALDGPRERALLGPQGIGEASVEPRTNYLVGRARRDWSGGGSFLGAIPTATNRRLVREPGAAAPRSAAYLAGADGAWSWDASPLDAQRLPGGSRVTGSATSIASTTALQRPLLRPPRRLPPVARPRTHRAERVRRRGGAGEGGGSWIGSLRYDETSPGFEPNDLGFRTRADSRWLSGTLTTRRDSPGGGRGARRSPSER